MSERDYKRGLVQGRDLERYGGTMGEEIEVDLAEADLAAGSPFDQWWEGEPVGARFVLHEPAQDLAEKGWKAALEWAAGQVEAAGCICRSTSPWDESEWIWSRDLKRWVVDVHDPACPYALAAMLRRGRP